MVVLLRIMLYMLEHRLPRGRATFDFCELPGCVRRFECARSGGAIINGFEKSSYEGDDHDEADKGQVCRLHGVLSRMQGGRGIYEYSSPFSNHMVVFTDSSLIACSSGHSGKFFAITEERLRVSHCAL